MIQHGASPKQTLVGRGLNVCLITLIAAFSLTAVAQVKEKPQYEIYAIRYASVAGYPAAQMLDGADPARKLDIALWIWLIRGNDRLILLDTGFYHDRFFKFGKIDNFIKPSDAVAQLGFKPEDVTDVIISHMHWDHVDGIDLFPNAKIWIQRDEYVYYTGEAWQQLATHLGIDAEDVLTMVKANTGGHVLLINGDSQEIIPGITCYTGGKHTYQSQYVTVSGKNRTVVLASDNIYLYENLDKHIPVAHALDIDSNLRAQKRMEQLASDRKLIVPGHDPAVLDRFPKVNDHIVKIE